jgi:hypothetical protein
MYEISRNESELVDIRSTCAVSGAPGSALVHIVRTLRIGGRARRYHHILLLLHPSSPPPADSLISIPIKTPIKALEQQRRPWSVETYMRWFLLAWNGARNPDGAVRVQLVRLDRSVFTTDDDDKEREREEQLSIVVYEVVVAEGERRLYSITATYMGSGSDSVGLRCPSRESIITNHHPLSLRILPVNMYGPGYLDDAMCAYVLEMMCWAGRDGMYSAISEFLARSPPATVLWRDFSPVLHRYASAVHKPQTASLLYSQWQQIVQQQSHCPVGDPFSSLRCYFNQRFVEWIASGKIHILFGEEVHHDALVLVFFTTLPQRRARQDFALGERCSLGYTQEANQTPFHHTPPLLANTHKVYFS